jgi:hypothetical protein
MVIDKLLVAWPTIRKILFWQLSKPASFQILICGEGKIMDVNSKNLKNLSNMLKYRPTIAKESS